MPDQSKQLRSYPGTTARFEEPLQRRNVRFVGVELDSVHSLGAQVAAQPQRALRRNLLEAFAHHCPASVELDYFAGFRVLQRDDAYIGKLTLTGILNMQCD